MEPSLHLADLFKRKPRQFGLRGDSFLWDVLRDGFTSTELPDSVAALTNVIGDAFRRATGHPIDAAEDFHVPDLDHGGMSSGWVSVAWWRDKALPLLRRRYRAAAGIGGSARWYNGYSWEERAEKLKVLQQRVADGDQPPATGPCDLCGDPRVDVEHHDEDYSKPYLWTPPALLTLCRHCHRSKLHTRFSNPIGWLAHLAHVRRGGYASDLTDPHKPEVKIEMKRLKAALKARMSMPLAALRPYRAVVGEEWFARLSMDPASLTAPSSRPRP